MAQDPVLSGLWLTLRVGCGSEDTNLCMICREEHEVIFKYRSQMEEAFQNRAVWNQQPVARLIRFGRKGEFFVADF